MHKFKAALIALGALAVATPAMAAMPRFAPENFHRIDRQQEFMVRAGVRTGELTNRELRRIAELDRRNATAIRNMMFSDGRFTPRERARAHALLQEETDLIRFLSNNRRDRDGRFGGPGRW
ncbi:MAG: hypothetical protein AB7J28_05975 [Hyphomonadaceae bacterium]